MSRNIGVRVGRPGGRSSIRARVTDLSLRPDRRSRASIACAVHAPISRAVCIAPSPLGIHPVGPDLLARAAEEVGMRHELLGRRRHDDAVAVAARADEPPQAQALDGHVELRPASRQSRRSARDRSRRGLGRDGDYIGRDPVGREAVEARARMGRESARFLRHDRGRHDGGRGCRRRGPTASASGPTCSSHRGRRSCRPMLPVPQGEVGALVVTPLFSNNVTPFLRWLSGDLVTLGDGGDGDPVAAVLGLSRWCKPCASHERASSRFAASTSGTPSSRTSCSSRPESVNDFKCEAVEQRRSRRHARLRSSWRAAAIRSARA